MGKKSLKKDRAYITASEWRDEHGGHKGRLQGAGATFKRLPFHCCAISFQPFEDPVCTPDGTVMDIINAVPYVQKFKRNPATGEPLELRDLIRLNYQKNTDGEYCCPALGKVFNENTHIVAIKSTGNVYCWEAIDQLCLKPKNLRDLITDEPFTRKDIIHLQDPMNLSGKNLADFDHVKKDLTIEDEEERLKRESDPMFGIKNVNEDTQRALAALGSEEANAAFKAGGGGKKAEAERILAEAKANKAAAAKASGNKTTTTTAAGGGGSGPDPRLRSAPREHQALSWKPGTATWNTDEPGKPSSTTAAGGGPSTKFDPSAGRPVPPPYSSKYETSHTTTGAASRSFTSTATTVATKNERVLILQQLKPKAKGYLRLHTNLGDLNLELHCDIAPKTCENFLALAEGGYYDGTKFHRSIQNFMVQGGDPTGTGKGGVSVFGGKFNDELDSRLQHTERGILSMANGGPNTNGSQFFITYKSARHLDFKHTIFGRVVGGFEVLTAMERIPTDEEDHPLQDITITGVTIFVNPYKDLIEEERKKERDDKKKAAAEVAAEEDGEERRAWFSNPAGNNSVVGGGAQGAQGAGGVGKYLKMPTTAGNATGGEDGAPAAKKTKVAARTQLSNFDAW